MTHTYENVTKFNKFVSLKLKYTEMCAKTYKLHKLTILLRFLQHCPVYLQFTYFRICSYRAVAMSSQLDLN